MDTAPSWGALLLFSRPCDRLLWLVREPTDVHLVVLEAGKEKTPIVFGHELALLKGTSVAELRLVLEARALWGPGIGIHRHP